MTNKDYKLLAEVFNYQFNQSHPNATSLGTALLEELITVLAADNPQFDPKLFQSAVNSINFAWTLESIGY
mgnify:CR=1 FL=1